MSKTTCIAVVASVALGLIVLACGAPDGSPAKAPSSVTTADGGTKLPEKAEHSVHEHDH